MIEFVDCVTLLPGRILGGYEFESGLKWTIYSKAYLKFSESFQLWIEPIES